MRKGFSLASFVFAIALVYVQSVAAASISSIRFAATSQKNRLVIDLDDDPNVEFRYGASSFSVLFDASVTESEQKMLPAGALINQISLVQSDGKARLNIPLKNAKIVRYFLLPPGQNPAYRIVVDFKNSGDEELSLAAQSNSQKAAPSTISGAGATLPGIAQSAATGLEASKAISPKKESISSEGENKATQAKEQTSKLQSSSKINSNQSAQQRGGTAKPSVARRNLSSSSQDADFRLLEKAKKALIQREYQKTITILLPLVQNKSSRYRALGLEFTGVALQRLGKPKDAKVIYQQIINEYPNEKNTARVRLRLESIEGIEQLLADKKLKATTTKDRSRLFSRGSFGGDYRYSTVINDVGDTTSTLSLLSLEGDYSGRNDFDWGELDTRVSYGRYQDLENQNNDRADRIRYLYAGGSFGDEKYSLRVGRQRARAKGVFGRFDGVLGGYQWDKDWKFNLITGKPVDSSADALMDSEQTFYGASVDIDHLWEHSKLSLFVINQTIAGDTDRQAIGGEYQYLSNHASIYSLLDYDYFFGELNAFIVNGNYNDQNKRRYSWSINQRKSPYIATRNALIGQSADSFAELQNSAITDDEILDLAIDRTLDSRSASFQYSQSFNKELMGSASLTWLKLSGAPGSGGVPAISESGNQFYLNLYLSASHWYSKADTNQMGLRYSSLDSAKVYSVYASSRYRWGKNWYVTPKIRFDFRDNTNATSQQIISPTLKINWQTREHYFYADLGALFYSNDVGLDSNLKTDIYYAYIGYRFYF